MRSNLPLCFGSTVIGAALTAWITSGPAPQGEEPTDPDRSGRITIAGEGAALETPDAMDGVDVGVDGGAAGAEEAAVHEIDDAVIGTAGAPVETEPSVADVPALADPELEAVLAAGDPQAERAREQAGRDLDGEAGST